MKTLILSIALLTLVGCEYVPSTKSSKPFSLSKIKNTNRQYERSGETPKYLKNFMTEKEEGSEKATEEAVKAVDPQKLASVRKAYGIPSAEGVKVEDREALLQLYKIEASRLKEILK